MNPPRLPRLPRLLPLAVLLAACADEAFVPRWQVTRLRVLAVVAEPPDALPGDTVTLTAHTAAPAGSFGPVRIRWASCPRLAIDNATGARRCEGEPAVREGSAATFPLGPAPAAGAPWSFFGLACRDGEITVDPAALQPRCAGDGEAFLRTVRIRTTAPNRNPRIARISLGDVPLDPAAPTPVAPGRPATLRVDFDPEAREATTEPQPDGTVRTVPEALLTQYLTDTGTLAGSFRSDDDVAGSHAITFTPPARGPARVWVVLSDGRGGFDVALREVAAGP